MHTDLDLHVFAPILGQNGKKRPHMYVLSSTSQPFFSNLELLMNFGGVVHANAKYVFMQKTELTASMPMLRAKAQAQVRLWVAFILDKT